MNIKMTGVVATMVVAATVVLAPLTHADETTFQQALADAGLPTGDTALELGNVVCADALANGVTGVDRQARLGVQYLDGQTVGAFLYAAVSELCPSAMPDLLAWANSGPTTRA